MLDSFLQDCRTCDLKLNLLSSMSPKTFISSTFAISSCFNRLDSLRLKFTHRTFVFVSFKVNLFSSHHLFKESRATRVLSLSVVHAIVQLLSSANFVISALGVVFRFISNVLVLKSGGPRTVPCGTPWFIRRRSDVWASNWV